MAYWPHREEHALQLAYLDQLTPDVQLLTGLPQRVPSNRITTLLCTLETQVNYLTVTFLENKFDKITFMFCIFVSTTQMFKQTYVKQRMFCFKQHLKPCSGPHHYRPNFS